MSLVKQTKNKAKPLAKRGHRWKPGQSGNPQGRPKHRTLMEEIRDQLGADGATVTLADIARTYIEAMNKGSFQHLKEYIDRESGKVPDRVANADGSNIPFDFSKLTTDELTALRAIRMRLMAARSESTN
jgi:hypothetical protein